MAKLPGLLHKSRHSIRRYLGRVFYVAVAAAIAHTINTTRQLAARYSKWVMAPSRSAERTSRTKCSDPLINVFYKLCATNVIRRTFSGRGFSHKICLGVLRASEPMIFGGTTPRRGSENGWSRSDARSNKQRLQSLANKQRLQSLCELM